MTIFPIIQLYPIYTPTSKQLNKHILIVVKCLQLSTIILRVLLKLGADVKEGFETKYIRSELRHIKDSN